MKNLAFRTFVSSRGKAMRRVLFLLAVLSPRWAQADCTGPVAQAGALKWLPTSSTVAWCDGTSWNDTSNATGASCTGTSPGTIRYDAGAPNYCNGSSWISMKGDKDDGCHGTSPGSLLFRQSPLLSKQVYESCDGSNWYVMKTAAAPVNCAAQTDNFCDLPNASLNDVRGTCIATYTGTCSYRCTAGGWAQISSACVPPTGPTTCPAVTIGLCDLPASGPGNHAGTCTAGYTGTCSDVCQGPNGWKSTPTVACVAAPANFCPATTISNCVLVQTNFGLSAAGTCAGGYVGTCTYPCAPAGWGIGTNLCVPAGGGSCPATTISHCALTDTMIDATALGSCEAGYTGTCSYHCDSSGAWSATGTNSCIPSGPGICTATSISNCDLPDTPIGSSAGTCTPPMTGSCSYQCVGGSWVAGPNTCAMPTTTWQGPTACPASAPTGCSPSVAGQPCSPAGSKCHTAILTSCYTCQ